MKIKEIIEKCCNLFDSYRPEVSPDEFIQTHLDAMEKGTEEQKFFILKTFSGIFQYSKVLNIVKGNSSN